MLLLPFYQLPESANPPSSVLAAVCWLGGVIVLGLFTALKVLWSENKGYRNQIDQQNKDALKERTDQLAKNLEVTIDATNRIRDSEQSVEAAMVIIHQLQGRQIPVETLSEISYNLRALRELKEKGS